MTQCDMILDYMMRYGSITPLDALREFGCMRLAARIADLEMRGFAIKHIPSSTQNVYGEKIHFMSYELE